MKRTGAQAHGCTNAPARAAALARGFTLIELLVALTIGALVVLLAHRTFAVASDLAGRVATRRAAHDRAMNARRFLAQAFGSLDVGLTTDGGFRGLADDVTFAAWLPAADDTVRRHRVRIVATPQGAIALVAPLRAHGVTAPDTLRLFPDAREVALDYLLDLGADAAWVREWRSPVSAPLAVRLRIGRAEAADTLLFVIGPRG